MKTIDSARPNLDYSVTEPLWKLHAIAWAFPKSASPLVLKLLFNMLYWGRYLKFRYQILYQEKIARRAKKMGIPLRRDTTFVGLQIFRDLCKTPFHLGQCLSGKLLIDYLKVRGRITLDNMVETGRVFAGGEWKNWKPRIHSDSFFHFSVLNSPPAYYLIKSDVPDFEFMLHLSVLETADLFPFGIHDVRKIYLNKNDQLMMIVMRNGDQVRTGDQYWELAKLCTQSVLFFYTISYSHSWVHLNFPDVVVAKTYSLISTESVFFKLMEPHIRYVVMTNGNGLSGRATARHLGIHSEFLRADLIALDAQPDFAEGLAKRAAAFVSGEDIEIARDLIATKLRLGFPHHGFEDSEVPYMQKLYRLYPIVRRLVETVHANIPDEHSDIERWKYEILKRFPHIDQSQVNTLDLIATFIWQSSFIHSIDHEMAATVFGTYGKTPTCMTKSFDLASDMKMEDMWRPIDLLSTWGCVNSFVRFNKSEVMDDSMAALDYSFENPLLIAAQEKFKHEVDDELIQQWTVKFEGDEEIKIRAEQIATSISF